MIYDDDDDEDEDDDDDDCDDDGDNDDDNDDDDSFFSYYFRFLLAKLNLTPGGLGLEALRLGPEEMAAQDDLQVASEKRPSDSLVF